MRRRTRQTMLPAWGYVLLNVVMLVLLGGIYHFSLQSAADMKTKNTGFFPVLVICYLSFLAVSIFDALYDRHVEKTVSSEGRSSTAASNPASASRESSRKPE